MLKKLDKPILAEGEATGHAHVLDADVAVEEESETGTREFGIKAPTRLRHQEHRVLELPPGQFVSDKVLEFDHLANEARKVRD